MSETVPDLYDRSAPAGVDDALPKKGLAGVVGITGTIWSALGETWNRMRIRLSFWTVLGIVAVLSSIYYFVFAESLYDSQAIISIQTKSGSSSGVGSILGSALGTSATGSQSQQVYEYIYSMDMLRILDAKFHLRKIYSSSERNPIWRLWFPDTDEDFLWFYQYMIQIDNQSDLGLMTIDVLDYDKPRSHAIAAEILSQSEKFMNQVNAMMQAQTTKFARDELENSVKAVQAAKSSQDQAVAELRLTAAQQALASSEGSANQQSVFIVPISVPSIPTETTHPERLFDIVTIVFLAALVYAVGFLMWSNVRDHRNA